MPDNEALIVLSLFLHHEGTKNFFLKAVLKAGCRVKNACIIELFMSYRGF